MSSTGNNDDDQRSRFSGRTESDSEMEHLEEDALAGGELLRVSSLQHNLWQYTGQQQEVEETDEDGYDTDSSQRTVMRAHSTPTPSVWSPSTRSVSTTDEEHDEKQIKLQQAPHQPPAVQPATAQPVALQPHLMQPVPPHFNPHQLAAPPNMPLPLLPPPVIRRSGRARTATVPFDERIGQEPLRRREPETRSRALATQVAPVTSAGQSQIGVRTRTTVTAGSASNTAATGLGGQGQSTSTTQATVTATVTQTAAAPAYQATTQRRSGRARTQTWRAREAEKTETLAQDKHKRL